MQKYPGRILGFCRINPNVGQKSACALIDKYIKERGMRGIKLHPEIDHFMLDERILGPIFDKARDCGVPIIFHSGNTANTDPLIIGHLAAQYPKVPVILGHMGLIDGSKKAAAGGFESYQCLSRNFCRKLDVAQFCSRGSESRLRESSLRFGSPL